MDIPTLSGPRPSVVRVLPSSAALLIGPLGSVAPELEVAEGVGLAAASRAAAANDPAGGGAVAELVAGGDGEAAVAGGEPPQPARTAVRASAPNPTSRRAAGRRAVGMART